MGKFSTMDLSGCTNGAAEVDDGTTSVSVDCAKHTREGAEAVRNMDGEKASAKDVVATRRTLTTTDNFMVFQSYKMHKMTNPTRQKLALQGAVQKVQLPGWLLRLQEER